jgi:hypothetical protein
MTQPSRSQALRFAAANVVLHAVLWLAWSAGMVASLRYLRHTFGGYAVKVPASTEMLLAAARWLEQPWYVLPVFAGWLVLDGTVSFLLRRWYGVRTSLVWSGLMLALPAVTTVYSFLSLWLPLMQLRQALPC